MNNCLDQIFKKESKWISIYQGVEEIQDPFEKNTITAYINPKSIKAIVRDMTSTKASYKMPGIKISRAKSLLIEKKYRTLIENSAMIEITTENHTLESYEGWKEFSKMQIVEIGDYLEINIFSKHT